MHKYIYIYVGKMVSLHVCMIEWVIVCCCCCVIATYAPVQGT